MEYFIIYAMLSLSSLASNAAVLLILLAIIGGIALFFTGMVIGDSCEKDEYFPVWKKWLKTYLLTLVIGISVVSIIPSHKEWAIILGAGSLYNLSQTEEAKKLPNNVLRTLNEFLEEEKESKNDR